MKSIVLILLVSSFSLYANAQNSQIQQKEFSISVEPASLQLNRGDSKKLVVSILKSKGFQGDESVMGLSSSLPSGVSVSFTPDKGNMDASELAITVAAEAVPGQCNVIVNCTMNHLKKGTIVKLIIN